VASYLRERGIPFRLVRHTKTVRTKDLPAARGVAAGQVMKNLLFIDSEGRPVLCIVGCDRQIDPVKVRGLVGSEVRLATASEVVRHTGYPIGNVPSLVPGLRTLLDSSVPALDLVSICSCLDNDAGVNLSSSAFVTALDPCQLGDLSFARPPKPSEEQIRTLAQGYGIHEEVARGLLAREGLWDLFEELVNDGRSPRVAGPFLASTLVATLGSIGTGDQADELGASAPAVSEVVRMLEAGQISRVSAGEVLRAVLSEGARPSEYVKSKNLEITHVDLIPVIERVLSADPGWREALANGDTKVLRFLIGKVIEEAGSAVDRRAAARAVQEYAATLAASPS
jgi:prolyl-tRNA editing enzyme YbaK/EbsC (Cys-tRNA(Pro) deacylase)